MEKDIYIYSSRLYIASSRLRTFNGAEDAKLRILLHCAQNRL